MVKTYGKQINIKYLIHSSSIEINNHKEAYIMSRRGTNIRKRTDGRWEGRYYIVDTAGSKKCKSVYGHSYKEVTERLLTAKAASLNQTAAPKQSAITVKAVAEKWLESIASSRKCSTIQKYSTIYNKYIKPNWGESVIDELNQNEILKELPETAGESVTKSILCIFNSILAYGAATYGTGANSSVVQVKAFIRHILKQHKYNQYNRPAKANRVSSYRA